MDQMLSQEGEEGTIANCTFLYMILLLFSYLNTIQTFLGIRSVLRAFEIKTNKYKSKETNISTSYACYPHCSFVCLFLWSLCSLNLFCLIFYDILEESELCHFTYTLVCISDKDFLEIYLHNIIIADSFISSNMLNPQIFLFISDMFWGLFLFFAVCSN